MSDDRRCEKPPAVCEPFVGTEPCALCAERAASPSPSPRDPDERVKKGFRLGVEAAARLVENMGDCAACDHAAEIRELAARPTAAPLADGGAPCTCLVYGAAGSGSPSTCAVCGGDMYARRLADAAAPALPQGDEPLSEKVRGWAHQAREAGEDVAAAEWDWHADAIVALESGCTRLAAAESTAQRERERAEALESALRDLLSSHRSLYRAGEALHESLPVVAAARAALSAEQGEKGAGR